jgi:hypothetical protein
MNRITPKLNRASAVDFADFDIEEPERLFHEDRQFELAFTDGKSSETYHDSLNKDTTTFFVI